MLNLGLSVNFETILLGQSVDDELIDRAKLHKFGYLRCFFLKKHPGTKIHGTDVGLVQCFEKKLLLGLPEDKFRKNTWLSSMACIYILSINNITYKIVCQILCNKELSRSKFNTFNDICNDLNGQSISYNNETEIWKDDNSSIISQIGWKDKNHFIFWQKLDFGQTEIDALYRLSI